MTTRPLAYAAAAIAVAAVLFLVTRRRVPERSRVPAPHSRAEGSEGGSSPAPTISAASQPRARRTASAAGVAGSDSTAPHDPLAFQHRIDALAREGTKRSLRALLLDWRTDRVTPAQDRALGARIGAIRSEEMDKAAGQLLLDRFATSAQRQGLAAILASSSSELAIGYLFAAGRDPDLRSAAAEGLATVSEPGALPALAAGIDRETAPELLRAMLSSLRNIQTPKARDLEARVRALLADR